MAPPVLTTVGLGGGVQAALALVPPRAGVGQLLGPEGRSLVIGRAAQLRRWAGSHLGLGRARKGSRPPTDLSPVAAAFAYALSTSPFHQRLVYERLMAGHVPPRARRDLRPPSFLRLDPGARFPRITIEAGSGDRACRFGPFRNRRAAERASRALHKLFPLRPCDFAFEPDPRLPLGLGCVYAQLRTCAAPCLARIAEEDYRDLARRAAAFLAEPESRPAEVEAWAPPWVGSAGSLGLVAEWSGATAELYPVRGGSVIEDARLTVPPGALGEALSHLRWPATAGGPDDWPWLSAWLHARRRSGCFLVVRDGEDPGALAARLLRHGGGARAMVT